MLGISGRALRRARHRSTLHPAVLAAVAAVVFAVPFSGTAQAVDCEYDPDTREVFVTFTDEGETATIGRQPNGAITVNGTPCGGATVKNTDTINVDGGELGMGETVTVDLANGGFPKTDFNITGFLELGT